MSTISPALWANFRQLINSSSESFFNASIVWHKIKNRLSYDGDRDNFEYDNIVITCYINYNFVRVWSTEKETESGEIDKGTVALLFNKDYLKSWNFIDSQGDFIFNPEFDYFTVQGEKMMYAGNTQVSLANDDPCFIQIIVERAPLPTGKNIYGVQ
jgi:hypothetical protein